MNCKRDWKKYRAGFEEKANEKLSALSVEEKVSLMSGRLTFEEIIGSIRKKSRTHYNSVPYIAGGADEIPAVRFVDGSRGVVCGNGLHTCFPVAVLRGATFNVELEKQVGRAIGEEVILAGGNLFGGVCLNVPYHPGWGRSQEVYGEDTFHISRMGCALAEGVQSTGVIACIKHFAFNSIENIRREVNVECDKKAERDIFLRQFEDVVHAGAGAVMTAYNSYKGVKCGENRYLIKEVLIDEWGFDGFVLSDFTWGITDTVKAVKAGQNLEMPNSDYFGKKLIEAFKRGEVSGDDIDNATLRIVRTLMAHESLINETKKKFKDISLMLDTHRNLAYRVAIDGITLLKNENVLPLKCRDSKSRIVVLGNLGDMENTGDRGSSQVYPPYVVTPLKGVINKCGKAEVIYYNGKNLNHCKHLATEASAVIVVAGNSYMTEGESISADTQNEIQNNPGGDRTGLLRIGKADLDIIEAVSEIRDDTIVLLEGGSTIVVDDFVDRIGALLFCYYPGMEGGNAIADILFGNVNPSGKLPFVIPHDEDDLQKMEWDNREQLYDYFHGYKLLEKNGKVPRFDYGFGLSYTDFEIKDIQTEYKGGSFKSIVVVKNIGKTAGAEVVYMFLINNDNPEGIPLRSLVDFKKVFIEPGESTEIILESMGREQDIVKCELIEHSAWFT